MKKEGELDFKHENILGGGESLGFSIRRGAKDPEPSVKIQLTDNKFGCTGAYDAQLFSEYIAINDEDESSEEESNNDSSAEKCSPSIMTSATYHDDEVKSRRGFRLNFRSPVRKDILEQSSASTALERTSTRTGRHETIASGTMAFGPIKRYLPLGAKTSFFTSLTPGMRIGGEEDSSWRLYPFSKQVSTIRQLFPLFSESSPFANDEYINLALETNCMASTKHLPRHEANAAGLAARVRGYSPSKNGPLRTSLYGSAEIRIPVTIPFQKERFKQDGKVVLFGDWMVGSKNEFSVNSFHRPKNYDQKSSIGIGLRKSIQGIPLKYDISVNKDGKVGTFVGLGYDWSID